MASAMTHGGNVFAVARRMDWDWRDIADFSASINPLGPASSVVEAIHEAVDRVVHYPEAEPLALREGLAAHWGIDPDLLLVGNGATELIHFVARVYGSGRVALAAPVFSEFHRAFPDAAIVPFDAGAWPADRLVIVTRPANPTGLMPAGLEEYRNPVLVDESFLDFTGEPSLLRLVEERENLLVLRSLTKFYALPGLRIGALAGPRELIRKWRALREPWQVNVLAEAAVLAGIADREYAERTRAFVRAEREWLSGQLASIAGLTPQPSVANYLLVASDGPVGPLIERAFADKILLRDCSGWPGVPFAHAFRVAVRPRVENERLIACLGGGAR